MSQVVSQTDFDNYIINVMEYYVAAVDYYLNLKKSGSVYLGHEKKKIQILLIMIRTLAGYDLTSTGLSDTTLRNCYSVISNITGLQI